MCAHEERLLSEGYGRLTDDVQFDQFIKNNRVFVKGQGVVTTDVPLNAKASINVGRLHFEYIPHFESIVEQIKHFFRWSVAKGSVVIQTPFKGQESSRVTKGRSLQESDSHDVLIKFYSGEGEHILRKVRALLGSLIQSSVDEHTVSLAKTPGEQSPDSVTSPLVSDENRVIDLSNLDSEDVVTDLTGDSGTSGSNSTVSRVSTIVLKSPYALLESSIRLAFPIYMSAESENIILNTEHFAKTQQSLQTAFGNDGASSTKGYHYGYIIPRTKKINRMVHLDDLSVDSADVAYELLSLNEQSVISAKNSMLLLDYTNFCSAKSGLIDWLNKLPTQPLSEPAIDERSKAFNSTVNASCQTFLTIQQQIRTICKGLNGTFKSSYRFSGQETVVKPSYEYFDRQWFMDLVSELGGSIYNLFYMERLFVDAGKKANGENVFIDPFDYRIHAQRHFLHDPLSFVSSRHYENMIQGSLSKGRYDSSNLATLINTNVAKQCNANMVYVEGEIYPLIKATREILKGEQIFLDYGSGWEERLEYLKGERKKHNFNNSIVSQRLAGENSPKSSRFYFDECDECKKRLYIEELDTMPIDVEAPDVGLRPVKRQRVVPTIFSPGDNIAQTDLLGAKRSSEKIYQQNALSDLNSRNATWYHDNIKLNYSKQDGFYLTVKKNIPRNTFLAYYKGKVVHKDHFNTCCKFLTDIGLFNDLEAIMEREKSGAAPSLIMRSSFFKYFSARDYHAEGNRNHSNKTSSGLSL